MKHEHKDRQEYPDPNGANLDLIGWLVADKDMNVKLPLFQCSQCGAEIRGSSAYNRVTFYFKDPLMLFSRRLLGE